MIANADNDRRGVALVPLSEPARDITLMPAGTARVALRQLAPKPYSIERVETLAAHRALPESHRRLRNRLAVRRRRYRTRHRIPGRPGQDDRRAHADDLRRRRAAAAGAGRRGKRRGEDDGEGAAHRTAASPPAWCARSTPRARRSAKPVTLSAPQDRETEAAFDLPVELRNDIARLEIAGERSAGAVQLLDKRWRRRADRRRLRRDQRHRAAAAGLDLLSHPRAVAVRRRAARRPRRAAAGDRAIPRPEAADDRAGRCRHAVAGNPRAPQRLDRPGRRAGALRRPAPGAGRRRSGAGQAAPRRPQPRRQPDLGKAAASGFLRRRRPVRRPCGAEGHHRQPAGAGRTGCRARRPRAGPRWKTARRW